MSATPSEPACECVGVWSTVGRSVGGSVGERTPRQAVGAGLRHKLRECELRRMWDHRSGKGVCLRVSVVCVCACTSV